MKEMKRGHFWRTVTACLLVAACLLLTGCIDDPFAKYTEAFNKIKASACFDADLSAQVTMDGTTTKATGNFKVDTSGEKTLLYLQADVEGETMTQFSDGDYLYMESRGRKVKYPLGVKPEQSADEQPQPEEPPEFNVTDYIKDFASFIEAGKLQEMGLFDPLPGNSVSDTQVDGNVYHLIVKDQALDVIEDALTEAVAVEGESVTAKDLSDFVYDATIEDGYVTGLTVGGTMTVTVPAAISGESADQTYPLEFTITAKFNNPGEAVSITLPSTDGYEG